MHHSQTFLITKWITDKLLGSVLLLLASPLMAMIALVIVSTSKGPILFRQKRGGLNQEPFEIYKFRTMAMEAANAETVVQARQNDPRITPFGGFLRRYSLDELPQLLNVLKGDMSLVGPRPHAVQHDRMFADICIDYAKRFRVKPGVTGLAQINGFRGLIATEEDIKQRTRFDNEYIDTWSVGLELHILILSALAVLGSPNAH